MKEYFIVTLERRESISLETLNALGKERWELRATVSVVYRSSNPSELLFYEDARCNQLIVFMRDVKDYAS